MAEIASQYSIARALENLRGSDMASIASRISSLSFFSSDLKNQFLSNEKMLRALGSFKSQEHLRVLVSVLEESGPDEVELPFEENSLQELEVADSIESFSAVLNKLPYSVKRYLGAFFLHLILPITIVVVGDMVKEYVSEFRGRASNLSERDQRKYFSSFSVPELKIYTDYHRFVSKKYLDVYPTPNSKKIISDSLEFGQVVELLVVQGAWAKVKYKSDDGMEKMGWVFTRYLSKFSK